MTTGQRKKNLTEGLWRALFLVKREHAANVYDNIKWYGDEHANSFKK